MQTDLAGKLLIAMPSLGDPRFDRSIILICAHDESFAMGIVVNKPKLDLDLSDVLEQMDIDPPSLRASYPLLDGGPVGLERGFVLHSPDRLFEDATVTVTDQICLTTSRDILETFPTDNCPEKAALALGYAGWGPGQLESEILENAWIVGKPDNGLIFGEDHDAKWEQALSKIGIDPGRLPSAAGRS